METPSSIRRLTRSIIGKKLESSALVDITNSPVVGLAAGIIKTPSSAAGKTVTALTTPSSGEAILRCQVKNLLLKKVDEEEETSVTENENAFLALLSHLRSPGGFLAPTTANTPQIGSFSLEVIGFFTSRRLSFFFFFLGYSGFSLSLYFACSQIESERDQVQEPIDVAGNLINRALLFEAEEGEHEDEDVDGDDVEDLCEGLRRMLAGKHTRFIYNSDEEIVGEEEVGAVSLGVTVLRGLQVPVGKHLSFQEEEEYEEEEVEEED